MRATRASFADMVKPDEKLSAAIQHIKDHFDKSMTAPSYVGDTRRISLDDVYDTALNEALLDGLKQSGLHGASHIADIFTKLEKRTITSTEATTFYNSNLPRNAQRLVENARLPTSMGAPLNHNDKKLYHAAQNLGYRHAIRIVKALAAYMKDGQPNIPQIEQEAAAIHKRISSKSAGMLDD